MYSPQRADQTLLAVTQFDPAVHIFASTLIGQKLPSGVVLSLG
jgi:hypothetical protein